MCFNKELAQLVNINSANICMHDWYLSLIASAFGEVIFINEATVKYRQHNKNAVGAKEIMNFEYIYKKIFKSNTIKYDLQKVFNQAEIFKNYYYNKLSKDNQKILDEFCKLNKQNKILKIINITRNNFLKQGCLRIIGEYIFI